MRFEDWRVTGVDETKSLELEADSQDGDKKLMMRSLIRPLRQL
jgi:hypothetical protein